MNKQTKKIITVIIIASILIFSVIGVVIFASTNSTSNKLNQGMQSVVEAYYQGIKKGKYSESYKYLSEGTQKRVSEKSFTNLYSAVCDVKNINFAINENVQVKKVYDKELGKDVYYVPVIKSYTLEVDGKDKSAEEDIITPIVKVKDKYRVYLSSETFYSLSATNYTERTLYLVEDSLLYSNDKERLEENLIKIDDYISKIETIGNDFSGIKKVRFNLNLFESYKAVIEKDYEKAKTYLDKACDSVEDKELIAEAKKVETEICVASGDYAGAANAIQEALDLLPNNKELRKDYRRITSIMLNEVENNLTSGWAQVSSAIKQNEKERERILEDIALIYAQKSIDIKNDSPDAYFLRGNVYYCLGDFGKAINDLEKSISLAGEDEVAYKNAVSEVLGNAQLSQAKKEVDFQSYSRLIKSDLRSKAITKNGIGGLVDQLSR